MWVCGCVGGWGLRKRSTIWALLVHRMSQVAVPRGKPLHVMVASRRTSMVPLGWGPGMESKRKLHLGQDGFASRHRTASSAR